LKTYLNPKWSRIDFSSALMKCPLGSFLRHLHLERRLWRVHTLGLSRPVERIQVRNLQISQLGYQDPRWDSPSKLVSFGYHHVMQGIIGLGLPSVASFYNYYYVIVPCISEHSFILSREKLALLSTKTERFIILGCLLA
jgi:hypothetical protein